MSTTSTAHTPDPIDAAFEARVVELERLAAEARRELSQWRAGRHDSATATPTDSRTDSQHVPRDDAQAAVPTPAPAPAPSVARRRALQALGGAAVGGAAAMLAASPAAATDGETVVIGSSRTAQSTTTLTATTTMSQVLHVRAANVAFPNFGSAIQGSTSIGSGYGVVGVSTTNSNGVGVLGQSTADLGTGVAGVASGTRGRGGRFSGTQANVQLIPSGSSPVGRSNVSEGDVVMTAAEELWVCVGTFPSQWRLVTGPTTTNAIRLVTPYRAYDSRPGFTPATGVKARLTQGEERQVSLASGANPPSAATGALVNLTATGTSSAGWLSIFKADIAWPGTSTLNWSSAGSSVANFAIVAMTSAGAVKLRCAGSTDVLIDVIGFV